MTKIKRFACLNRLATPPTHGLAGLHQAGCPRAGSPVVAVIPARGRVASSLFALAVVGWAVPGAGMGDEGGASRVWAAAAGHGLCLHGVGVRAGVAVSCRSRGCVPVVGLWLGACLATPWQVPLHVRGDDTQDPRPVTGSGVLVSIRRRGYPWHTTPASSVTLPHLGGICYSVSARVATCARCAFCSLAVALTAAARSPSMVASIMSRRSMSLTTTPTVSGSP